MTFEQAQLRKTELDEILDFLFKSDDLKDRLMRLKVARNEMNDPRYRADIAMVAVTAARRSRCTRRCLRAFDERSSRVRRRFGRGGHGFYGAYRRHCRRFFVRIID